MELIKPKNSMINEEIIQYILDNYPNKTSRQIALKLNINLNLVLKLLRLNNVLIQNSGPRKLKVLDLEILKELYLNQKLSINKISKKYNCSQGVINNYLKENNINIKSSSEMLYKGLPLNLDNIKELYLNQKLSMSKIATQYNTAHETLKNFLIKHKIKLRTDEENLNIIKSHKKKSVICQLRYIVQTIPLNERWLTSSTNPKKVKLQHRHIISKHLNRPLEKYENVHHINGNRRDNRLENLELWSTIQPCGQRVIDKLKYAEEIIKLYAEDVKMGRIK